MYSEVIDRTTNAHSFVQKPRKGKCAVCECDVDFAKTIVDVWKGLHHFCYLCSLECMFAYNKHPQYKAKQELKNEKMQSRFKKR